MSAAETFADRVRAMGVRPEAFTDECLATEVIGETRRGLAWQDVVTLEYLEANAHVFPAMRGDVPPGPVPPAHPRDPFAAVTWQTRPSEAEYARIKDYPGWPWTTHDDPDVEDTPEDAAPDENPDAPRNWKDTYPGSQARP